MRIPPPSLLKKERPLPRWIPLRIGRTGVVLTGSLLKKIKRLFWRPEILVGFVDCQLTSHWSIHILCHQSLTTSFQLIGTVIHQTSITYSSRTGSAIDRSLTSFMLMINQQVQLLLATEICHNREIGQNIDLKIKNILNYF